MYNNVYCINAAQAVRFAYYMRVTLYNDNDDDDGDDEDDGMLLQFWSTHFAV